MRGNAQPDGFLVGGSELRSYFLPSIDQSKPNYVYVCGNVRSLQRRFPIGDVLLHSESIRNQLAKLSEIAPKF